MIEFIPYGIFTVAVVLMFLLRHRLKFWGEWLIGFTAGVASSAASIFILDDRVGAFTGIFIPIFFMVVALFMGRGFEKFVANAMMTALAVVPIPWSLLGVFATVVIVLVYAIIVSPSAKTLALNFYLIGSNIAGMMRSMRESQPTDDDKPMNPWLVLIFVAAPTLLTSLHLIV